MTFRDADADLAVRDALWAAMPEARELSFERIHGRATRRRRRVLVTQVAALAAVVLCAGTAVAMTRGDSAHDSLQVTNPHGYVTPSTTHRSGHHTPPTTTGAPGHTPASMPTNPPHASGGGDQQTPQTDPSQPIVPPITNAPVTNGSPPPTSPAPPVATTPTTTTPYRPMIPSNLPPMSQYATSRFLVILTDDGYYISDSSGLHTKLNAHVSGQQFDVVFLDEREQSTDSAWLGTFIDAKYNPFGHYVQAYTHAWDGGSNNPAIREVFTTFSYSGPMTIGVFETGNDSTGVPGTRATLNLIKDS